MTQHSRIVGRTKQKYQKFKGWAEVSLQSTYYVNEEGIRMDMMPGLSVNWTISANETIDGGVPYYFNENKEFRR